MEVTQIVFTDGVHGKVQLFSDDVQAGKMNIATTGERLTVFHTEVEPEYDGRGFAKLLLEKLVSYAREKGMKIIPLCPFVHAQFTRHPEKYDDVWFKEWHQ